MPKLVFYTKKNCLLCDEVSMLLELLSLEYDFELEVIDIYEDESFLEKYHMIIPVVKIGEAECFGESLTYQQLEAALRSEIKDQEN